jgi:hypothetical protein
MTRSAWALFVHLQDFSSHAKAHHHKYGSIATRSCASCKRSSSMCNLYSPSSLMIPIYNGSGDFVSQTNMHHHLMEQHYALYQAFPS